MLSHQILHRSSAAKSGHYYAEQKDDYYARDGNNAQWQGAGAKALGLTGEVSRDQLVAAMRGDFKRWFGEDLGLSDSIRKDAKARAALDMTFSAPKSISIQSLVGKDATVLAAHDHAVTRSLDFMEKELLRARQKVDGVSHTEKTQNAIIAKFRHETARPTMKDEADPQLHTHALLMNLTQRADGTWVALSNDEIYRAKQLLDAVYKNEMAAYLQHAGYALRFEDGNFELANISRAQIEHFSKRGMTVEAELAKIGQTRQSASRELKQAITLATRKEKQPDLSRADLQARWERDARELGIDFSAGGRGKQTGQELDRDRPGSEAGVDAGTAPAAPGPGRQPGQESEPDSGRDTAPSDPTQTTRQLRGRVADECMRWAIAHLTERESVTTEKMLISAAMEHARGTGVSIYEIQTALREAVGRGHLVQGAPVYRLDQAESEILSRDAWVETMIRQGSAREAAQANVKRAILTGGLILDDVRLTTQAAREREKRILQIERDGRGAMVPVMTGDQAKAALADIGLKPGQQKAAELILTSANRVVGVQGLAGTGKSHMLNQVKQLAEAQGYTVRAVAAYGTQAKALELLGVEANTIASMLEARSARAANPAAGTGETSTAPTAPASVAAGKGKGFWKLFAPIGKMAGKKSPSPVLRKQDPATRAGGPAAGHEGAKRERFQLDEKTILVVDEAGVVPTRQMEKLLQRAEKAGARVMLLGDQAQTKAIEAGRPFHQLQDAGMQTALMGDIIRQQDPILKRAVEVAAVGRASEALHIIESRLNAVHEIEDKDDRYSAIANRYAQLEADVRRQTLIVTGTNDSRNAINDLVHDALGLQGKGRECTMLTRIDTTQSERRSAKYYRLGDIIQPERTYQGGKLAPDNHYAVVGINGAKNRLTVKHLVTGETVTFNPQRTTKLSVYQKVLAELSAGDWVRVTRNDAKLDIRNGERYQVAQVSEQGVTLSAVGEDGQVTRQVTLTGGAEAAPLHLDRAYASTVHSAQGLSETGVILNQESTSRTTKRDVFYVGISRAKHWIDVFTNDKTKLPFAVDQREDKSAALDIGVIAKSPSRERRAEHGI
ncbi:MobF family relaxase [Bordetella sp. FB-8]|uniref:MobF family relaxase n=1 Tax=Bordetella sp. FB-8 TaxID=1159870 RepID=UPI00037050FE|nr:MobF family relaxase [Bordetella sp. FB-8]